MLPHLQAATIYVGPLTTGAGTRVKPLGSLAAGLPIVATTTGIEDIDGTDGQEVLIAEDPGATVTAALCLLADHSERRRLGEAARRLAETCYDWSRCLAPMEQFYAGFLPARGT